MHISIWQRYGTIRQSAQICDPSGIIATDSSMLLLFRESITSPMIIFTSGPTCFAGANSIAIDVFKIKGRFFPTATRCLGRARYRMVNSCACAAAAHAPLANLCLCAPWHGISKHRRFYDSNVIFAMNGAHNYHKNIKMYALWYTTIGFKQKY